MNPLINATLNPFVGVLRRSSLLTQAKARLMSTSCASVYPAALIAAKSSLLTVPLVSASVRTKRGAVHLSP